MGIDMNNRQPVDHNKRPDNKSVVSTGSTAKSDGNDGFSYSWQNKKLPITTMHPVTLGLFHYPMDPGHPIVSYNGPYNPNYTSSTEANIAQIFQLSNQHEEKIIVPLKDKSKSKNDAKKHAESTKPHKEIIDQHMLHYNSSPPQRTFLGPLVSNKFPMFLNKLNENINENTHSSSENPIKHLLKSQKNVIIDKQLQFTAFNESNTASSKFFPNNDENIPLIKFNPNQFSTSDVESPYHNTQTITQIPSAHDPNYITASSSVKKKSPFIDKLIDDIKSKPSYPNSAKIKPDGKKPGQEILRDELLHLINLHHSGSTQLDNLPEQDHPGFYKFHQQIINRPEPPTNQLPLGYFGRPIQESKKSNPHIIAHKNEHGETTYHVHTSNIPNSPQQIQELLGQITQHDSNNSPFQHYPNRSPTNHNYPNGLSVSPTRIEFHDPNSGLPHLNHPLTVQTSIQSGSFLIHGKIVILF